jgi:thiol-disulfide isomerase/thioredoxin
MRKLEGLMEKTFTTTEYILHVNEVFRDKFLSRMETYKLNENAVEELRKHTNDIFVLVFSAEWCKDCMANVPILALLEKKIGLKVGVFGNSEKGTLKFRQKDGKMLASAIVNKFKIREIPHIVVFDVNGQELGKIIENPSFGKTLEEEILELVKKRFK